MLSFLIVGEEATVCGVGCGGAGQGALSFVGTGQGEYIQETTYKYVGCGGDFDTVRPRRDFTCLITSCCLLSLLLLIPLLCWLISGMGSTELYNCSAEMNWEAIWSEEQKEFFRRRLPARSIQTAPLVRTLAGRW